MKLMKNKKGIIMGVANERSIAWGIAQQLYNQGADLFFTYQTDNLKKRIVPLIKNMKNSKILKCDVSEDESNEHSIENVFLQIKKQWKNVDFVVHAIAFSDKDELKGRYLDTSRNNFIQTLLSRIYFYNHLRVPLRKLVRRMSNEKRVASCVTISVV